MMNSGRKLARRFLKKERELEIVPFDDLFPNVEKHILRDSIRVELPELESLEFAPGLIRFKKSWFDSPEWFYAILEDVLYCPTNGVVFTDDGRILAESISSYRHLDFIDVNAISNRLTVKKRGLSALYRSLHNNHYHSLVDNPPRIHALGLPELKAYGNFDVLLKGSLNPMEEFLFEKLRPENTRLWPARGGRIYRLERLCFVSYLSECLAHYLLDPWKTVLRDAIVQPQRTGQNRRIYVSRQKSSWRRILNNAEVEAVLHKFGFETVYCEDMGVAEQAELFADATHVIGVHGAGLSNVAFARDTTLIELFSSRHFVPCFYFLAHALGHEYRMIYGDGDWRTDDCQINIDELSSVLSEVCK